MAKKYKELLEKAGLMSYNAIDVETLKELSLNEAICVKTLKKLFDKPSVQDLYTLMKMSGEIDDNKVILTPIDQALEDVKVDVDN